MPRAEIIAVGSELLGTQRVDTNSLWLTGRLDELGFEVTAKSIIGDEKERLVRAFQQAWQGADLVVSTGGLGPTEDDLTREAAAAALGLELQFQPPVWEELQAKFARMGRSIPENNRRQAMLLSGGEWLPNPQGTAPGQFYRSEGKLLAMLPGPPRELKPMVENFLLARLAPFGGGQKVRRRLLKVIGLGESALDERIAHLYRERRDVSVTTLFTPLDLEVHLSARGSEEGALDAVLGELQHSMQQALGEHVYACREVSLAEVVGELLRARNQTLACAESLTGGLLARRITDVAGASAYFVGSFVTYTEAAKQNWLGVAPELLREHSAVSSACAEAMARGARERSGADYALSLTGYAGPTGGTEAEPAGTVYCGLAEPGNIKVTRWRFPGDREMVRSRAAQSALDLLRRALAAD